MLTYDYATIRNRTRLTWKVKSSLSIKRNQNQKWIYPQYAFWGFRLMNISNNIRLSRIMIISLQSLVLELKRSTFNHCLYTISFKLKLMFKLKGISQFFRVLLSLTFLTCILIRSADTGMSKEGIIFQYLKTFIVSTGEYDLCLNPRVIAIQWKTKHDFE